MSARLFTVAAFVATLGACAADDVRMESALPLVLRQALSNFNQLTATLSITQSNGEAVSGFPKSLEIQADGTVSTTVTLDPSPNSLKVLLTYEDTSRTSGATLVMLDQSMDKLDVSSGDHAIDMDHDAAQNSLADRDYDANDNGVSNLAEVIKGWTPDCPVLRWVAEVESARELDSYFQLEAAPGGQVLVGRSPAGAGGKSALSVVDGDHPERRLVELGNGSGAWTADFPSDASRSRVLVSGCFQNCSTGTPIYGLVSKVYGAGGDPWTDEFSSSSPLTLGMVPPGAPAVAPDGTVWLAGYNATLWKVSGGVASSVGITGTGVPSCFTPPTTNNNWLADGRLYLPFPTSCGSPGGNSDMGVVRVLLPSGLQTSAALEATVGLGLVGNNLLFVQSDASPPAVTVYAATNTALKAFDLSATTPVNLWTTSTQQVRPSCGNTGMNTSSAPAMSPGGPVWAMFCSSQLFAFDPAFGADPIWQAELLTPNLVGNTARELSVMPSGGVGLVGVFPNDPGSPMEAHSGLTTQRLTGGLAIAPPKAATDSALALTDAFFANSWQDARDTQAGRPESNVLVTSDTLYFVASVLDSFTYVDATTAAVKTVSCAVAPCHYLFAAAR
jgi:hypothetical protein